MVFENTEVKIIVENGEPLFEVYSTGMALGQVKTAKGMNYPRKDRIEENLKTAGISAVVRCGQRYITESQLYDLMLEMKTDKVKPFRKWVVSDVLPPIRKHGAYMTPDKIEEVLLNPDTIITLATQIKEERQKRLLAEQQIEEMKPLAEFADHVSNTKDLIDVGRMAKLLHDERIDIGRNKLFQWLRENRILMKNNTPYQSYVDGGYFKVRESTQDTAYGSKVFTTTYITGKGQIYITERLRKEFVRAVS